METAVRNIINKSASINPLHYLRYFFGDNLESVQSGAPVIIYGAGSFASHLIYVLRASGIYPAGVVISKTPHGSFEGLPIMAPEVLRNSYPSCIIAIASRTYSAEMIKNLYDLGFKRSQICWPKIFNEIELGFFHNINFGSLPRNFSSCSPIDEKRNWLEMHKEKIEFVYEMLADEKSRAVFVDRIALSLNWDSISHYSDFIINHSEAVNKFGVYPIGQSEYSDGIENYFYFNNDIIAVKEGAIFVDAGAYTGDSVLQFYEAAVRLKVDYKKIIVFEPGEAVLKLLDERIATHGIPNVEVNKVGLWSSNGQLKYSEDVNGLPGSGTITECGNVEIPVTTLDSHLGNENITLLKIDTPGAVWDAVKGAQVTIKRCRPDLVLGIYHSPEAIFETPYLVHTIEPNYKLYIRHNQWFINETDLIATF